MITETTENKVGPDCEVPTISGKIALTCKRNADGHSDFVAHGEARKVKDGTVESVTKAALRGCGADIGLDREVLKARAVEASRHCVNELFASGDLPEWSRGANLVVTVSFVK